MSAQRKRKAPTPKPALTVEPLTPVRWNDLVELFGRPGASFARSCYCMAYRRSGKRELPPGLTHSEANKRELKALVDRGVVPGLIGYRDARPVGWVSLGPRGDYLRLARSTVMKPVDDKPVWSIICFFVDAKARGQGVAQAMLDAAVAWARANGVTLLEAYPCETKGRARNDSLWFGSRAMFDHARFAEVARRSPTRSVMRRKLRVTPSRAG